MDSLSALDRPGLLRLTRPSDGVALIQMDDDKRNNALSHEMVTALGAAFACVGADESVRAVVLAGGIEYFSSGANPEVLRDLASGRFGSEEILLPLALLGCPLPIISAMSGHAVGGGFALGITADIVIMGRESRYCLNFLDLGFTPGMGATVLLEHVLSPAVSHELLYSGEARRGRDFEGLGGINHILPRAEVLPKALDLAGRFAEKPRAALAALKGALSAPRRRAFEAARLVEARMHAISFAQPGVAQEIERMFFEWSGR
jgi:polyketide biosynthesis enoyl-CoA hydratase PksI